MCDRPQPMEFAQAETCAAAGGDSNTKVLAWPRCFIIVLRSATIAARNTMKTQSKAQLGQGNNLSNSIKFNVARARARARKAIPPFPMEFFCLSVLSERSDTPSKPAPGGPCRHRAHAAPMKSSRDLTPNSPNSPPPSTISWPGSLPLHRPRHRSRNTHRRDVHPNLGRSRSNGMRHPLIPRR